MGADASANLYLGILIEDLYEKRVTKTPYAEHDKKGQKTGKTLYDEKTEYINKITGQPSDIIDVLDYRYIHELDTEMPANFIGVSIVGIDNPNGGFATVDPAKIAKAEAELKKVLADYGGDKIAFKLYVNLYWSI